jgi:protein ImuA
MTTRVSTTLQALRERLRRLDDGTRCRRAVLPYGIPTIDEHLPEGGLALGALHEVAGGGNGAIDGAAVALFAAGIAARTRGRVLWCVTRQDLFAPAIASAGLAPGRVIYVEAEDEKTVLACFEEGLRHGRGHGGLYSGHSGGLLGGLGAVVAEVARLSMTASRRLQLAAEGSGAIGIAIRRRPASHHTRGRGTAVQGNAEEEHAADFGQPTAAVTRWRVSTLPSAPLPVAGVGRARWRLELIRSRGGESACFDVEACDAQGRLALSSDLVHRPGQEATRRRRTAS